MNLFQVKRTCFYYWRLSIKDNNNRLLDLVFPVKLFYLTSLIHNLFSSFQAIHIQFYYLILGIKDDSNRL